MRAILKSSGDHPADYCAKTRSFAFLLCRKILISELLAQILHALQNSKALTAHWPLSRARNGSRTVQITATPLALGMNGGGAAWFSQSDRSARSMFYLLPLRIAANPHRFRR
jgi:hypothetical protein